jgi:DNA topoisomerase-1
MLGKEKKEKVLNKAKKAVTKICDEFKQNEDKIGKELGEAIIQTQNDKAILGPCPNCGGTLKILFSPFTKKMFVGCSSYSKCKICGFTRTACKCKCPICKQEKGKCKCGNEWNPLCKTAYPLPGGALIYKTDKICEKCKTPIIQVFRRGRRFFRMCLDPKCETKADWGKPKEKIKKTSKKK